MKRSHSKLIPALLLLNLGLTCLILYKISLLDQHLLSIVDGLNKVLSSLQDYSDWYVVELKNVLSMILSVFSGSKS